MEASANDSPEAQEEKDANNESSTSENSTKGRRGRSARSKTLSPEQTDVISPHNKEEEHDKEEEVLAKSDEDNAQNRPTVPITSGEPEAGDKNTKKKRKKRRMNNLEARTTRSSATAVETSDESNSNGNLIKTLAKVTDRITDLKEDQLGTSFNSDVIHYKEEEGTTVVNTEEAYEEVDEEVSLNLSRLPPEVASDLKNQPGDEEKPSAEKNGNEVLEEDFADAQPVVHVMEDVEDKIYEGDESGELVFRDEEIPEAAETMEEDSQKDKVDSELTEGVDQPAQQTEDAKQEQESMAIKMEEEAAAEEEQLHNEEEALQESPLEVIEKGPHEEVQLKAEQVVVKEELDVPPDAVPGKESPAPPPKKEIFTKSGRKINPSKQQSPSREAFDQQTPNRASPRPLTPHQTEEEKMEAQRQFEEENPAGFSAGSALWARVGSAPYWPCAASPDPYTGEVTRVVTRAGKPVREYHVQFFGQTVQRAWVNSAGLLEFKGLAELKKREAEAKVELKKRKSKIKLLKAFVVSGNSRSLWEEAVKGKIQ